MPHDFSDSFYMANGIDPAGLTLHVTERGGGSGAVIEDEAPDREEANVARDISRPRGKRTLATHLRRYAGVSGVKSALLHEVVPRETFADPALLAGAIKSLPLTLSAARPLDEALGLAEIAEPHPVGVDGVDGGQGLDQHVPRARRDVGERG